MKPNKTNDSPATLVAILVAARKVGDRDLEQMAKSRLEDEHGVKLVFMRDRREVEAAAHA